MCILINRLRPFPTYSLFKQKTPEKTREKSTCALFTGQRRVLFRSNTGFAACSSSKPRTWDRCILSPSHSLLLSQKSRKEPPLTLIHEKLGTKGRYTFSCSLPFQEPIHPFFVQTPIQWLIERFGNLNFSLFIDWPQSLFLSHPASWCSVHG